MVRQAMAQAILEANVSELATEADQLRAALVNVRLLINV